MQAGDCAEAPSSQYHGVTWDMQQKQWQVTAMTGRCSIQFGWYRDEEEAACAHDAAAVVIGPQARLNFPTQVGLARARLGSVCVRLCLHMLSSPSFCLVSCVYAFVCTLSCVAQYQCIENFVKLAWSDSYSLHESEGN